MRINAYPKYAPHISRYIRHMSDNAVIRIDAHRQIYPHGHPYMAPPLGKFCMITNRQQPSNLAGWCLQGFPPYSTGNNIRWPTTTTNNPDDIFWQCGAYKASTPLGNNIRWPTTLMAFSGGLQGLHPLRATKSDGQQPRWHLTEICKTSVSLLFALITVLIFDRHKRKSQNDIIITIFSLIILLNF